MKNIPQRPVNILKNGLISCTPDGLACYEKQNATIMQGEVIHPWIELQEKKIMIMKEP